jgi:hypothetical protein
MARLKRTAERIREEAAEGIAKSLEGLPTWKPEHSEKVEKGIVELKLCLMRDRLDKLWVRNHFSESFPNDAGLA